MGTWQGAWSTVNNCTTWTRPLSISDSDTKGAATFSGLSITNLAGIEVTTITNGENYTVGGFTARSIVFGAWPNRESDIGTVVADTSKLVVFNIFHQQNMTYQSGLSDSDLKFTVTNGSGSEAGTKSHIYNRDYPSALTNSGGQPLMTVEETV